MRLVCIHDQERIAQYLAYDADLHIYEIGDLAPKYWPATLWYGLEQDHQLQALALLYVGLAQPILLALATEVSPALYELTKRLQTLLPRSFYAHIHPDLAPLFARYQRTDYGLYYKMRLVSFDVSAHMNTSIVEHLTYENLPELQAFFDQSYPGHSFEAPMMASPFFYGIREHGQLVSAGGVHIYAPEQRVAALGNIATAPQARGRGYGKCITAKLCQDLRSYVDHIGLNVRANNQAAIHTYQACGFTPHAEYLEASFELTN